MGLSAPVTAPMKISYEDWSGLQKRRIADRQEVRQHAPDAAGKAAAKAAADASVIVHAEFDAAIALFAAGDGVLPQISTQMLQSRQVPQEMQRSDSSSGLAGYCPGRE